MGTCDLRVEQARTLAAPRLAYGALSRALFAALDLVYGRRSTLAKFRVLELVARVPYQAWESVGYVAITHTSGRPGFARRIVDFVEEARAHQDNEQWHLLILEELVPNRFGWWRRVPIPQLLALVYYHVSWLLYVLRPAWSYRLHAEFEDHAEHTYMEYVAAHPELERRAFMSAFEREYGRFASMADLLRCIALDEREHKDQSLARLAAPRFGLAA